MFYLSTVEGRVYTGNKKLPLSNDILEAKVYKTLSTAKRAKTLLIQSLHENLEVVYVDNFVP